MAQLGVTSALVSLSKTESANIRELIARVLNAVCKHQVSNLSDYYCPLSTEMVKLVYVILCVQELRGLVVQQGGSKALIPLALEGTDKGKRCAASALSRIGITQVDLVAGQLHGLLLGQLVRIFIVGWHPCQIQFLTYFPTGPGHRVPRAAEL